MRVFFMPEIKLKVKTIDPITGSDVITKRVISINPNDPYNSIEFHKIADALGVKRFDRLNHHISDKLAVVYNYISKLIDSNDVEKIVDATLRFQKNTGTTNYLGSELITKMYRIIRLDMDRKNAENKRQEAIKKAEELSKDLLSKKDRSIELKTSGQRIYKQKAEQDKNINKQTESLISEFKKEASKKVDNSKVEVVEHKPETKELM
jgi:hypothetical protein